jgi:hypothetical protein
MKYTRLPIRHRLSAPILPPHMAVVGSKDGQRSHPQYTTLSWPLQLSQAARANRLCEAAATRTYTSTAHPIHIASFLSDDGLRRPTSPVLGAEYVAGYSSGRCHLTAPRRAVAVVAQASPAPHADGSTFAQVLPPAAAITGADTIASTSERSSEHLSTIYRV